MILSFKQGRKAKLFIALLGNDGRLCI